MRGSQGKQLIETTSNEDSSVRKHAFEKYVMKPHERDLSKIRIMTSPKSPEESALEKYARISNDAAESDEEDNDTINSDPLKVRPHVYSQIKSAHAVITDSNVSISESSINKHAVDSEKGTN